MQAVPEESRETHATSLLSTAPRSGYAACALRNKLRSPPVHRANGPTALPWGGLDEAAPSLWS